ncbi:SCO family protein [Halobacterium jilantaiense]|uniref:Protein SCO1/2 n=1 Tax=Halobacterium jilantaiense TaxID=355548 RepID=A0A1I0P690_9EURY|nr:SCO family protein [Halobacterium jilantaiense]SEW09566.1 protein SCO1/2 [Halobacterium jilantaiense]
MDDGRDRHSGTPTGSRRAVLRSTVGVAAAGSVAGCLGVLGDDSPTVLSEPDRQFDSGDLPYPAWGERVPDVTVPAPLSGGEVATRDVAEPALYTFFYSHCNTVCPVLISTMRNVQTHAANEGYADEVSLFPVTFDPERDTADRLGEYAGEMNVDADADSWTFLRPDGPERADAVVSDAFGVTFQRTHPDDMDAYMFTHSALTFLVNGDGYVERAYRSKAPNEDQILDDLAAVRDA